MVARLDEMRREQARELWTKGWNNLAISKIVGCSYRTVGGWREKTPWSTRHPRKTQLTYEEREEIAYAIAGGERNLAKIARILGRDPRTVQREVKLQGIHRYRAWRGQHLAEAKMARPKMKKLEEGSALGSLVETLLRLSFSPQQISEHLKKSEELEMQVSHETIYKTLYVQSRGAFKEVLKKYLRSGRTERKQRGVPAQNRGRIRGMVNISKRPSQVSDRAVPGHWEGDLIVGTKSQSAIGTLVERTTRFVLLVHLPSGHSAEQTREALAKKICQLPTHLKRSLTWDQGSEMAPHALLTAETGLKVYFCDPHSPWQRGSNENTNGLLRQYFPKSTDLSRYDEAELDRVALELNIRPRKTLNWESPAERMEQLLRGPKRAA